jgi:hypothetical protein
MRSFPVACKVRKQFEEHERKGSIHTTSVKMRSKGKQLGGRVLWISIDEARTG